MEKNIKKWLDKNFHSSLENKTIIITGANSGIGYYVSYLCAYFKANLIMAVRSLERGEKAKNELLKAFPEANVKLMSLDLESIDSINNFINKIKEEKIDIDVFYNNAGILKETNKTTKDGYPQVMGVNYLGMYLLNEGLKEYFKLLDHDVKVIFTTSIAQYVYKLNYEDLLLGNKEYKTFRKYANSKRAITHYFLSLKDELEGSNIKTMLVHPGITYTPIISKSFGKILSFLADKLMNFIFHKVNKASLSTIYLLNDDIAHGTYVGPRGLMMISGYPTIHKISKKIKKDYKKTIEITKEIIKS